MATRTWDAAGASTVSVAASWSDNTKPVAGDGALFNATGVGNCTFDETLPATGALASLEATSAYTGTIDLGNSGYTLAVIGPVTLDCTAFDCGDATIDAMLSAGQKFDYQDVMTWTRGTSTIILRGTGELWPKGTIPVSSLTIAVGASITSPTAAFNPIVNAACTVNGTFTIGSSNIFYLNYATQYNASLAVGAAGRITGPGTLQFNYTPSGYGLLSQLGTIDCATLVIHRPDSGAVLAAATYASTAVTIRNDSTTASYAFGWQAGTTTFTGTSLTVSNSGAGQSLTITNAANGAIVLDDCDLILTQTAGTLVWTKGTTGSITFTGSGESNLTVGIADVLDPIVVAKGVAGSLAITTNVACASLTITSGEVNCGSRTLTISGDMTIAAGGSVGNDATSLDGALWTIGGMGYFSGAAGALLNLSGTGGWTLTATGGVVIQYATIAGCNATGSTVPVVARNCVNGGGNTGITFLAADATALAALLAAGTGIQGVILGDSTEVAVYAGGSGGYGEEKELAQKSGPDYFFDSLWAADPFAVALDPLVYAIVEADVAGPSVTVGVRGHHLLKSVNPTLTYTLTQDGAGLNKVTVYYLEQTDDAAAAFDVVLTGGVTETTTAVDTYVAQLEYVDPHRDVAWRLAAVTIAIPENADDFTLVLNNVHTHDHGGGAPADGTAVVYGLAIGSGVKVKNLAVSSTTLLNGSAANVSRGVTTAGMLTAAYALNPQVYYIGFGTNDSKDGVSSVAAFTADLKTRIDEIRTDDPAAIIILGTDPRGLAHPYDHNVDYHAAVRTVAAAKGCTLFDVEAIGRTVAKERFYFDDVHENTIGQRTLGRGLCVQLGVPYYGPQIPMDDPTKCRIFSHPHAAQR